MIYTLDTEFIDTPSCSALISLAVVREDGESRYYEFDVPKGEITPWLTKYVVPYLEGGARVVSRETAARELDAFFQGDPEPQVWTYCGAYDWYFFCRLWGGFMNMPLGFHPFSYEFAHYQRGIPDVAGAAHNALNDAISLMAALRAKGMVKP